MGSRDKDWLRSVTRAEHRAQTLRRSGLRDGMSEEARAVMLKAMLKRKTEKKARPKQYNTRQPKGGR